MFAICKVKKISLCKYGTGMLNRIYLQLKPKILRFYSVKPPKPSIRDELLMPEFVYAGKNIRPHKRVYVMGITTHGALGVNQFLRPDRGKPLLKWMQAPFRLNFGDLYDIEDIACGYGFTVFAVNEKDKVPPFFGTGIATNCQIGCHVTRKTESLEMVIRPSPIDLPLQQQSRQKKVACGRAHTLVWTDTEGLWTFGNNSYGQCGRPVVDNEEHSSRAVYHRVNFFNNKSVEQIECGQDTSFVVSEGRVYSCGWSADGQTGRGTYENVASFGAVGGELEGEKVVKVSSGADCILALSDKGEVFGWGNSEYRQLGSVTEEMQMNSPKKLELRVDGRIIDVATSGTCCFLVTDSGSLWSWGYGILGVGPKTSASIEPVRIPSTLLGRTILNPDAKVCKVYAGLYSVAAITSDGGLYTWGRNAGGCLGLGHTNFQHFPMRVCVASEVKKVSIGADHMVVLAKSLM